MSGPTAFAILAFGAEDEAENASPHGTAARCFLSEAQARQAEGGAAIENGGNNEFAGGGGTLGLKALTDTYVQYPFLAGPESAEDLFGSTVKNGIPDSDSSPKFASQAGVPSWVTVRVDHASMPSPFARATEFSVTQTPGRDPFNDDDLSHETGGEHIRNAWDLQASSENSYLIPVYALGDGIVVDFQDDIEDGSINPNQWEESFGTSGIGNFLTIKYWDLAGVPFYVSYFHLSYDGVAFPANQDSLVREGDILGIVGRTGDRKSENGDATHLHINVGRELIEFGQQGWVADGTSSSLEYEDFNFVDFDRTTRPTETIISSHDVASSYRQWTGSSESDAREGHSGNDLFYGGGGRDYLGGGYGNDIIVGQDGNDHIDGSYGIDNLSGGEGDDRYNIGLWRGPDIVNDAGDGFDTVYLYGGGYVTDRDQIQLERTREGDLIITMLSSPGSEEVLARFKIVNFAGSGKIERLVILAANEESHQIPDIDLAREFSLLAVRAVDRRDYDATGGGFDMPGSESFTWRGDSADNRFSGSSNRDIARGNEGSDVIAGNDGDDILLGDGGADVLNGGDDEDLLIDDGPGDLSVDNLAGGSGDDTLVFYGAPGDSWDEGDGGSGRDLAFVILSESSRDWRLVEDDGRITVRLESGDSRGEVRLRNVEQIAVIFGDGDDRAHSGDDQQAYFEGGDGDDDLTSEDENDYLDGGDGNDKLDGGTGVDWLDGGDDYDRAEIDLSDVDDDLAFIADEAQDDDGWTFANGTHVRNVEWIELITGDGDDQIWFDDTGGDVSTEGGQDVVTLTGQEYTRVDGGSGDDRLVLDFGWADERIDTDTNNDDLVFHFGSSWTTNDNRRVYASSFEEFHVWGSDYDDQLDGDGGDDQLTGRDGDDRLRGRDGEDTLSGEDGEDLLNGEDGADLLLGGDGGDDLIGLAGDDLIYGGDGEDEIEGGLGQDQFYGGTGADTFVFEPSDSPFATYDVIHDFQSGTDRIDLGALYDGTLWLATLAAGADTYVYADLDQDHVWDFSVMLRGAVINGNDIVIAGLGESPIGLGMFGDALGNALTGGSGTDTISGLAGDDVLTGGAGADSLVGGLDHDVYYIDNRGDRVVELRGQGADKVASSVDYNALKMGGNVETIVLTGTARTAVGDVFANTLIGNASQNVLNGYKGADIMEGRGGNDLYTVDNIGDVVVEAAGGGIDTVRSAITYDLSEVDNVENLFLLGGADIDATGNDGANTIRGAAGDNVITGRGGIDVLHGGAGADRFVYESVSDSTYGAYDRIRDLKAEDIIDLRAIDADTGTAGDQAFTLVDDFSGTAGEMTLTYNSAARLTWLIADTDGDGDGDFRMALTGNHESFAGIWE